MSDVPWWKMPEVGVAGGLGAFLVALVDFFWNRIVGWTRRRRLTIHAQVVDEFLNDGEYRKSFSVWFTVLNPSGSNIHVNRIGWSAAIGAHTTLMDIKKDLPSHRHERFHLALYFENERDMQRIGYLLERAAVSVWVEDGLLRRYEKSVPEADDLLRYIDHSFNAKRPIPPPPKKTNPYPEWK